MRKGHVYEVIFEMPGKQKPRRMVARYISTEPRRATPGVDTVTTWDLRPLAGTQTIPARSVNRALEVPKGTPLSLPEIHRG